MTSNNDVTILTPDNQPLKLESGVIVDIVPLKLRETLKVVKIIINGAGPALGRTSLFSGDTDGEEWAGELVGLIIAAIPNAEDETVEFLQAMVKPHELVERPFGEMNKQDREKNDALWAEVYEAMYNPELGDTLAIIEAIFTKEADNLKSLGKQIRTLLEKATKTSQSKSTEANSSVVSVESSILSPANTATPTNKSKTSRSQGSAKSSPRSQSGGPTKQEPVVVS